MPRDEAARERVRERIAEGSSVLPMDLEDCSRETLVALVIELADLLAYDWNPADEN